MIGEIAVLEDLLPPVECRDLSDLYHKNDLISTEASRDTKPA